MLAPDAEELVIAYLTPTLVNVATDMPPSNIPFPFYLVNRISGGDDKITEYPAISIHAFNTTRASASDAARAMHNLMTNWSPKHAVVVTDGVFGIDYIETIETPAWRDYDDKTLQRYVGRYRIHLRLR